MHLRSIALALAVLPLLALPVRAQDGPAPQNSSRTDLFIGFGGQNRLGNEDAGWRSAIPLSVDVNVTDRVALVVMPALGVGVSTSTGSWVDYAFQAGPRFRFGGQQRVTSFVQILAGAQHGTVAPQRRGARITSRPWDGIPDVLRWWRRRDPDPAVRVARHPDRRAQPVRRPERWPPARGIVGSGDPFRRPQVAVRTSEETRGRPSFKRRRQSVRRPRAPARPPSSREPWCRVAGRANTKVCG